MEHAASQPLSPVMISLFSAAVGAIFGAVIGFIGAIILDEYRRWRTKKLLHRALKVQLIELRHTVACVAFSIRSARGRLDKPFLNNVIPIIKGYEGPDRIEALCSELEKLGDLKDEDIERLNNDRRAAPRDKALKEVSIPLSRSQPESITLLPSDIFMKVINLELTLESWNQDVNRLRSWFEKTFDETLSSNNRKRIEGNIEACYDNITVQGERITEKATATLDSLKVQP